MKEATGRNRTRINDTIFIVPTGDDQTGFFFFVLPADC